MPNTCAGTGTGQQHAYTCQAMTHCDSLPFPPASFLCTSQALFPPCPPVLSLSPSWAGVARLPLSPGLHCTQPRAELLGQKMSFPRTSWSSYPQKNSFLPNSRPALLRHPGSPAPTCPSPLVTPLTPTIPPHCPSHFPFLLYPGLSLGPAQLTLSGPCKAPGMPCPLFHLLTQPHT